MGSRPKLSTGRFALALLLVVLDQVSKARVFAWLPDAESLERSGCHFGHERVPLVGDWLALMRHTNPGAAFGRFSDYPHLLVLGRVAVVVYLSYWLLRFSAGPRLVLWGMVLVYAGAIGNVLDNLWTGPKAGGSYGEVRDFIDVWFINTGWGWDWHFPTFNVADSCITVGACLWVLSAFVSRAEPEQEEESSTPSEAGAPGADAAQDSTPAALPAEPKELQ